MDVDAPRDMEEDHGQRQAHAASEQVGAGKNPHSVRAASSRKPSCAGKARSVEAPQDGGRWGGG